LIPGNAPTAQSLTNQQQIMVGGSLQQDGGANNALLGNLVQAQATAAQ
jgi:hypothetical protein